MKTTFLASFLHIALNQRIKSTDFPQECRGMYYFSKGRHAHQEREGSGKPYFVHVRGVAFIVKKLGGTSDQISAALAHDLEEDTETSFEEICYVANSDSCAELCAELRNNRIEIKEVGKEQYMTEKLIGLSNDALLIKLADMLYNSYDMPSEKALNRMYKNVCAAISKRPIDDKCRTLANLILLADPPDKPQEETQALLPPPENTGSGQ